MAFISLAFVNKLHMRLGKEGCRMGYYDQDDVTRSENKHNRRGYLLTSILGAIIGAIIMIIALLALSKSGFISMNGNSDGNASSALSDNKTKVTTEKMVSVDVVTEVTKAVDKAGDAVVGITNLQTVRFWNQKGTQEAGTGSGVIYKKEDGKAYIVTNHHVVEGATELEVTLPEGTKVPAKLRGSDIWTDLAVIEIDAKDVKTVAEFGDSDALKIGEPVIAIGNPLGAMFSGSVTQGIVSGLERTIPVDINQDGVVDWNAEVIQTDAAINPGNSGGALVNLAGQVVGINSMKIAEQAVEGIGLSIPINFVGPIVEDLVLHGEVKRPYMGIELESVDNIPAYYQQEGLKLPRDVTSGVAVMKVVPNSPAAKAGLKEFDVIVEMDDEKIEDVLDLRKHLYNRKQIGDQMKVKFYRNGKIEETTVTLTEDSL